MKKPNPHRNSWLNSQQEKNKKRRDRLQKRCRHRNRYGSYHRLPDRPDDPQETEKPRNSTWGEVKLPERLDLEENYDATVATLNKVRLASTRLLRLRYLNFDGIRFISPAAALLLASEVNRWKDSVGGRVRATDSNWHPPIKKLLCQMGLFELLNLERPKDVGETINTTFLPFIRGNVDDRTHAGLAAKELRQQIEKIAGISIRKHLLSDGITEAATNVCHHAYRKRGRVKKRYKPWWMSASYSAVNELVTVVFYDHGYTIPGTLMASGKMERWKHRIGRWNDGERIRAAMTIGRSSTGKSGRGKGLRNFLELISGHRVSRLVITSRAGHLTVGNIGNNRLDFRSELLETSLNGTLIEWRFVPNTATDQSPDVHLNR